MSEADSQPSRLRRRLTILGQLSWRERGLLVEAAGIISLLNVALRLASVRRVHALLAATRPADLLPATAATVPGVQQVSRVVAMASRHTPVANTCLHRSLALWWLLRRRQFDAELLFGVRKAEGQFGAHAWVKYGGRVLNDRADVDREYQPLRWDSGGDKLPRPNAF